PVAQVATGVHQGVQVGVGAHVSQGVAVCSGAYIVSPIACDQVAGSPNAASKQTANPRAREITVLPTVAGLATRSLLHQHKNKTSSCSARNAHNSLDSSTIYMQNQKSAV